MLSGADDAKLFWYSPLGGKMPDVAPPHTVILRERPATLTK